MSMKSASDITRVCSSNVGLGADSRKMCFAPAGKKRPEAFTTTPGSEHILVRFEREKKK